MKTFKVEIDGEVDAESAGDAARKISEHFAWVAAQWNAEEPDFDNAPQAFSAPSTIEIRPI